VPLFCWQNISGKSYCCSPILLIEYGRRNRKLPAMKSVKLVIQFLILLMAFFLVTVPSLIYGISGWLLIPVGWLVRLFIGRPAFSYKAGVIVLKLSTISLLLVVPAILYLYVWEPLGIIFFCWMGFYLLIRIYSGVHERERTAFEALKQLDALERKYENTYTKYNPGITIVTIVLNVAVPVAGYYLGGEKGLWIGIAISAVVWILSPFARETVIEKPIEHNQS